MLISNKTEMRWQFTACFRLISNCLTLGKLNTMPNMHPLLLTTPPITCIAAAFVQARQTQVISTHFTFIIYLQFSAKRCHEAPKVVAKGSSEGVLSVNGCHLGFTVTKCAVSRIGPKLPPYVLDDTACCGEVSLLWRLTFSFTQAMYIMHTNSLW